MLNLSITEENYLKVIFILSYPHYNEASTNDIAKYLKINPASVSDMLKKLQQKNLIEYVKYQGVQLTHQGIRIATDIIRKHRIWETFLVNKLNFSWDEVHEIAEQLEHIRSPLLTERLYEYLGYPEFDPHGEPIPNSNGDFPSSKIQNWVCLTSCKNQQIMEVKCVRDDSSTLLQLLDKKQIKIGTKIKYIGVNSYDNSIEIEVVSCNKILDISKKVAEKIYGVIIDG